MKKNLFSLGLIAAAAFTLTNCAQEIENPIQEPEVNGHPFEIVAKTTDTKTVNDGMSTNWVAGDKINLFHVESEGISYSSNNLFTITEENLAEGKFTGTLTEELAEYNDWYALYPYAERITTPAENEETKGYTYIGYKNGLNQTGYNSMASLKNTVCPLYGIASEVEAGDTPEITMRHLSSVVEIKVTNKNDEPLIVTSASLTAEEDIVGSYYIDITKYPVVYTPSGGSYVSTTAAVNVSGGTELAKGESASLFVAIKPFTAANGSKLVLSVNGYNKELTLTKDVTFTAGKIKTINFNYDQVEDPISGDVYTIEWSSANDWAENATKYVSGYYTIKNLKNTGSTEPTVNANAKDCRVYANGSVTISHSAGVDINKLVFNISQNGKKRLPDVIASTGNVTIDATNYKVIWYGSAQSVTFTVGEKGIYGTEKEDNGNPKSGQLCFDSIDVVAEPTDLPFLPVLKSISVSGMNTQYVLGDTFEFDGVVTANYFNQESKEVAPTKIEAPEMEYGSHVVTITYTEGDVTATTTYNIFVDDPNAGSATSGTETIDFSALGYTNGANVTTVNSGSVSINFSKGTNKSNSPKYYTTGVAVRIYGGNSFTVTAGKNVTKVVFTFSSGEGDNQIIADSGNISNDIWEGKAESVTFTIDGTSGHRRISKLEVTYEN